MRGQVTDDETTSKFGIRANRPSVASTMVVEAIRVSPREILFLQVLFLKMFIYSIKWISNFILLL